MAITIVTFVLIGFLLSFSNGYVVKFEDDNVDMKAYIFDQFGYLSGGKLIINAISLEFIDPYSTLWFYMCTRKDVLGNNFLGDQNPACFNPHYGEGFCTISLPFTSVNNTISNTVLPIESAGNYYFLISDCNQTLYNAKFDYITLNPHDQQLSSAEIPNPVLHMILLIIWFLIIVAWCFNWIKNRSQRIKLHGCITLFPVTKFAYCCASLYYWRQLAADGVNSQAAVIVMGIFYILFEVIFYSVLLVIASGWGISRDDLGKDKILVASVAIGLAISLTASYALQGYFTLLIVIIYVVILVVIFRNTNINIAVLQEVVRERERETDPNIRGRNVIQEKFTMFKRYKLIMLSYLIAEMTILFLRVLFLDVYPWIYQMLTEILQLLMFICIGWTFRLRASNIYYRLENNEDPSDHYSEEGGSSSARIHVQELSEMRVEDVNEPRGQTQLDTEAGNQSNQL